jgi:hypothetical protein
MTCFSALEKLSLVHIPTNILGEFETRLQSLRDLSVDTSYEDENCAIDLESFLTTCNPLASLSLKNAASYLALDKVLTHHGATLHTLLIHEAENPGVPRRTTSHSQLKTIGQLCPLLSNLTIDIHQSSEGAIDPVLLSTLGAFPNLSILQLYLTIGLGEDDRYPSGIPFFGSEAPKFDDFWTCTNRSWIAKMVFEPS